MVSCLERRSPSTWRQWNVGLIPNLRNPFTEINMPTRIFENLAMEKPVIVPNTAGIRDYFDDSKMIFFEPGSSEDWRGPFCGRMNTRRKCERSCREEESSMINTFGK